MTLKRVHTPRDWKTTQVNNMATLTQTYKNSVRFGLPAVSTTLCMVGTFANLTSLIYFVKKKDKTIGDKLLMLLNSEDFLLCICATLISAYLSYLEGHENTASEDTGIVMKVITILYLLLIDGTAYVTCLLSVTRAIGIVSPFYQIRGKLLVILGISVFVVIEFPQLALLIIAIATSGEPWLASTTRAAISILIMLTVLCATILAVYKLTRADLQGATENVSRNNRKATWTVVILSVLFLAFNSILLGATCITLNQTLNVKSNTGTQIFATFALFLAIPLNSSINPIVYFTRMTDMRQFFIQNFQKLCHST